MDREEPAEPRRERPSANRPPGASEWSISPSARSRSHHAVTSVTEQEGAGYVPRVVAGEEDHRGHDVLGFRDPCKWRPCEHGFAAARLPVLAVEQRLGLDEAGPERVHPYVRGERVRVRLRNADDRVLRGCVLRRAWAALDDDARADVDNRARLLV